MSDKIWFWAAGAAGIALFAFWWWRSRQGRWFRWSDPFALLLLAAWLTPCFGFFHWELGYLGHVVDACGEPVAYALLTPKSAKPLKAAKTTKAAKAAPAPALPKRFDAPLAKGVLRTDAEGLFQVESHFRWTSPFTEVPVVRPKLGDFEVVAPGYATVKFLDEPVRGWASLRLRIAREHAIAACRKCEAYYPREKQGLSEDELKQLFSAAKKAYWAGKKEPAVLTKSDDPRWCEFMALWNGLASQVGPKNLCRAMKSLEASRWPMAEDLLKTCSEEAPRG